MTSSTSVSIIVATTVQLTAMSTAVQLWLTAVATTPAALKSQNFLFQLKIINQLRKSFTLPKTFPYLLIIHSTKSHLVTYLALYKEDQATTSQHTYYTNTITHLSHTHYFEISSCCCHMHISILLHLSYKISLLK